MYRGIIIEAPERNGTFIVRCPEFPLSIGGIISADPEHDLCQAMAEAGMADSPIQFYRDGVPTLFHPSVHRWGARRIKMGDNFPQQEVKREVISAERKARLKANTGKAT
jgi:hypothetical protein